MKKWCLSVTASLAAVAVQAGTVNPEATLQWRGPEHIWRSSCVYCHSNTHFAPELLGRNLPVAFTTVFVRQGAPGMPVFRASELTDSEVKALAEWIQAAPLPATSGGAQND